MISFWKTTSNRESEDDVRYRGLTPAQRRHRDIQKAAYLIWIEHGSGNGRDLEDWLEAERNVDNRSTDASR